MVCIVNRNTKEVLLSCADNARIDNWSVVNSDFDAIAFEGNSLEDCSIQKDGKTYLTYEYC